jgi:hypothetical protein
MQHPSCNGPAGGALLVADTLQLNQYLDLFLGFGTIGLGGL